MKRGFHLTRGPGDAPDEVRREIELHLELRAREFEAQGMSPEAARRAALEAFGDRSAIESEVSEMRGTTLRERGRRDRLGELAQDVRIALRGLARAPGFTAVALLTLAIGIGANSAIFGVVRSVLLRPLPYPGADRLGQLWSGHRAKGRAEPEWLTPPQFVDWQAGNRTFAAMAGYQRWAPDLTGSGEPESLNGYAVSWNFLDVLGVNVARGRGFQAGDDDAGAERGVILSDQLWRRRFAADTAVLGRVIQLNSEPWTVIGVLPPSFRSPVPSDVWRPTRRPATSGCGRGCVVVRAIGRLKPGVTVAEAKADLDAIQRRLGQEYPETDARVGGGPIGRPGTLTRRPRRRGEARPRRAPAPAGPGVSRARRAGRGVADRAARAAHRPRQARAPRAVGRAAFRAPDRLRQPRQPAPPPRRLPREGDERARRPRRRARAPSPAAPHREPGARGGRRSGRPGAGMVGHRAAQGGGPSDDPRGPGDPARRRSDRIHRGAHARRRPALRPGSRAARRAPRPDDGAPDRPPIRMSRVSMSSQMYLNPIGVRCT